MSEKQIDELQKSSEKIEKLMSEEEKIKNQIEEMKQKLKETKRLQSQEKRKLDTRKKIIIGGKFIKFLGIETEDEAEKILEMFGNNINGQKHLWKEKKEKPIENNASEMREGETIGQNDKL